MANTIPTRAGQPGAVAPGSQTQTGGAPHTPEDVVRLAQVCREAVASGRCDEAGQTLLRRPEGDLRVTVGPAPDGEGGALPGVFRARLDGITPADCAWAEPVLAALEGAGYSVGTALTDLREWRAWRAAQEARA